MVTENQVFISKPLGDRVMLITDVKRNGDKTVYSATIIDYGEMTISKVVDEEENCFWLTEWWRMVTNEDVWEGAIDNFAKWMKTDSTEVKDKHNGDVAKDREFFQSIIGQTYKRKWGNYFILIRSVCPMQPYEHKRKYGLEIISVDCEDGEILNGERIFTHSEISTCYDSCGREEFENALAGAQKAKADKPRENSLAIRKKTES